LEPELPVDGTTGYDALREITGVFVQPAGAEPLGVLAEQFTGARGDTAALEQQERALKATAVTEGLAVELARLCRELGAGDWERQVVALVQHLPVYRADYPSTGHYLDDAFDNAAAAHPELPFAALRQHLLENTTASRRFAQLSGAAMAKAVEDCLFYRTSRLVALQEVGGDPGRFGVPRSEMHLFLSEHARQWPRAMTALSTHDTKRGEDVRARIAVLSQVPSRWAEVLRQWESLAPAPDRAAGYFLWQNFFGVWPRDGKVDEAFQDRLRAYARKALREAAVRTTWADPDLVFEAQVDTWIERVCSEAVAPLVADFVGELHPHAWANSLGQKLLQLAAPGIPDVYQGTELLEDSLVDPDNRRAVDFAAHAELLDGAAGATAKLHVVRTVLQLRRERPDEFVGGDYDPLTPTGPAQSHVVGFARARPHALPEVIALASRFTATLEPTAWAETTVPLPAGKWVDRLSGGVFEGSASAERLFHALPVALLVRGGEELRAPSPLRPGDH
jgi:(1->4)-alpha-D-glucan 1-alpha-D-glucosylmutase